MIQIYFAKDGTVQTPYAHACLPGITRQTFIDLFKENKIPVEEKTLH